MKESEIKIIGKMDDESREEFKRETVAGFDREVEKILSATKQFELPKNEEDLRIIEKINIWLEEYFKNIGAEEFVKKIKADQFVILQENDFVKIGHDMFDSDWSHHHAKMMPGMDIVFVKRLPETEKFAALVSYLHEAVHIESRFKLNAFVSKEGVEDPRGMHRLGYSIKSTKKGKDEKLENYDYFDGLNEAITQMITLDILRQHGQELERDYSITPEEQKNFKFKDGYMGYEYVYMVMLQKLAENLNQNPRDYNKKFNKNIFTGDLMFLRDVEKVFGKGSLRVLAFMGSHPPHASDLEMIKFFEGYFLTEDENERKEIVEKIFSGEEDKGYFEKYKKRAEK